MTEDKPLFDEAPVDFMAKKPKKAKKPPTEAQIQQQICEYIRLQYPDVFFTSDMAGVNLNKVAASRMKGLRFRGVPDLMIFEARHGCHALFIELKRPEARVFYAKTHEPADEHVTEQIAVLNTLRAKGYCAEMVRGFDNTKIVIDWYLKETSNNILIGQPINGLNQLMR
jgi:hypothetical protein